MVEKYPKFDNYHISMGNPQGRKTIGKVLRKIVSSLLQLWFACFYDEILPLATSNSEISIGSRPTVHRKIFPV